MLNGEIVPSIVYAGSRALISQQKQHKGEGGARRSFCVYCKLWCRRLVHFDAGGMTRAKGPEEKKKKTT